MFSGCTPRRLTVLGTQRPDRPVLVERIHPILNGGGDDDRHRQQLSEQAFREVRNPNGSHRSLGVQLFELSPGVLPWRRAVEEKTASSRPVVRAIVRKMSKGRSKRQAGEEASL